MNIEEMKKKLDSIENKGGSSNSYEWFKPTEDVEYTVRFLPDADGTGDPFAEVYWHYGVNGDSFVCNQKTHGDDCAVCELATEIWNASQQQDDKEMAEVAKDLFATRRFYSNIFVREQPEKGVQIYGYPKSVAKQLLETVVDPDYGDITDPAEGRDVKLKATKAGDANYAQVSIRARPARSKLLDDDDEAKRLLEEAPNVIEAQKTYETERVKSIVDDYVKAMNADSEGTVKYDTTSNDDAGEDELDDVESAFSELQND